jgi:hypothetical protein
MTHKRTPPEGPNTGGGVRIAAGVLGCRAGPVGVEMVGWLASSRPAGLGMAAAGQQLRRWSVPLLASAQAATAPRPRCPPGRQQIATRSPSGQQQARPCVLCLVNRCARFCRAKRFSFTTAPPAARYPSVKGSLRRAQCRVARLHQSALRSAPLTPCGLRIRTRKGVGHLAHYVSAPP